jgi:3-oxoacyl-[acyl-carrier protein] reductase
VKGLAGRVAIVTGAASGVGLGIASVLAQEGASVAVTDLNLEGAQGAADRLRGEGHEASAFVVDVVDRASVETMAKAVLERYGRLDILAANAGIYPVNALLEMSDADWDRVMDVNVKGAVHSLQACIPTMQAQHYGRIVVTSSITGPVTGQPGLAHYAASKAALLGLMRSAALEFIGDGITVNGVQPGNVLTAGVQAFGQEFIDEMAKSIPLGRWADPAEIGWAVRFFASEEAGYITGQSLIVDGGQVLPEGGIDAPG